MLTASALSAVATSLLLSVALPHAVSLPVPLAAALPLAISPGVPWPLALALAVPLARAAASAAHDGLGASQEVVHTHVVVVMCIMCSWMDWSLYQTGEG